MRFFDKGIAVKLESWSDSRHSCLDVIASYGGWVAICDLPFYLWNEEIFKAIGMKCGGLLEVDRRTTNFTNLFEARLKVRGFDSGFLPSMVEIMTSEASINVRLKPLSRPIRRRELSRPWIFRQDASVSSVGGRRDEKYEGSARIRGIVGEDCQLGRQRVLIGEVSEVAHDSWIGVDDVQGRLRGVWREKELGLDKHLGCVSTQDGARMILHNGPINSLSPLIQQRSPNVLASSKAQVFGELEVGVDPTFELDPTHNDLSADGVVGRAPMLVSGSSQAQSRTSELSNELSNGCRLLRKGLARIDHGDIAISKSGSDPRLQLNPNEVQLGLADLVDRSTGDLSQSRCDNLGYAMVGRAELDGPQVVDALANEVEEGVYNPYKVLQALDEYESSELSDDSSVQEERDDGKVCDDGSDSCGKVGDSYERGHMNSVPSAHIPAVLSTPVSGSILGGEGGESQLGPDFLHSSRVISNGEDFVSHVPNNSLDTNDGLLPLAAIEEDHRTKFSEGTSRNHGLGVTDVSGTNVDETEHWLKKMSKYVSFPLEEGNVPHFVHLLDTLGLSLVKNNGLKSRSKKRAFVSKGGKSQRSSGHRKGWRELRNLASGINYEGWRWAATGAMFLLIDASIGWRAIEKGVIRWLLKPLPSAAICVLALFCPSCCGSSVLVKFWLCCFGERLQFNYQVFKAVVLFLLLCLELVALRNLETLDISINGYHGGEFTGD
ncbi:hypothetical protein LOK49_LG03G01334 [Camellia lanceoleosa]|uniref:Uncharacterized protein n=1 Tax=Camellia lanceoleosa TaxID=1840588 RepID=A0ACC0IFJ0_9ERIC|nr:hypothetical protein LOK49_LG03G01334 [Camellia lanceoleosa]